jgi:hypothetical protein
MILPFALVFLFVYAVVAEGCNRIIDKALKTKDREGGHTKTNTVTRTQEERGKLKPKQQQQAQSSSIFFLKSDSPLQPIEASYL